MSSQDDDSGDEPYDTFWSGREYVKPFNNPMLHFPPPELIIKPPEPFSPYIPEVINVEEEESPKLLVDNRAASILVKSTELHMLLQSFNLGISQSLRIGYNSDGRQSEEKKQFSFKEYTGDDCEQEDLVFRLGCLMLAEKVGSYNFGASEVKSVMYDADGKKARDVKVIKTYRGWSNFSNATPNTRVLNYEFLYEVSSEHPESNRLDIYLLRKVFVILITHDRHPLGELKNFLLHVYGILMDSAFSTSFFSYIDDILRKQPNIWSKTFLDEHFFRFLKLFKIDSNHFIQYNQNPTFYPALCAIRPRTMYAIREHSWTKQKDYVTSDYYKYPIGNSVQEIWSEWSTGLYGKMRIQRYEEIRHSVKPLGSKIEFQCPIREAIIKFITFTTTLSEGSEDKAQYFVDLRQAYIYFNDDFSVETIARTIIPLLVEHAYHMSYSEFKDLDQPDALFKKTTSSHGFEKLQISS